MVRIITQGYTSGAHMEESVDDLTKTITQQKIKSNNNS